MLTLKHALAHSLEYVLLARDRGLVTEEMWLAYAHAWQTGAPRFGEVRWCQCESCKERFPASEGFRPPFSSEQRGRLP